MNVETETGEVVSTVVHAAFVEAWNAIENPPLDGVNPHFKSRYATLPAIMNVVRKACAPNGICYMQRVVKAEGGRREIRSYVIDRTGAVMELSNFPVETPQNPQSFGSNMTYAKRQQAQADWGIAGEEDDDGNAAAADSWPKNLQCRACGAVYRFDGADQAGKTQCNCGVVGDFGSVR